MMRSVCGLLVIALLALAPACSSGGGGIGMAVDIPDNSSEAAGDVDANGPSLAVPDVEEDFDTPDAQPEGVEVANAVEGCEALCGRPCVVHMGFLACPPECGENAEGWDTTCVPPGGVGDPGTDGQTLGDGEVISLFAHLCRPCISSIDCASDFQAPDKCVALSSKGRFCGTGCSTDDDCPSGYTCTDSTITEPGPSRLQCVPESADACACTSLWEEQGASTVCYVENDFGACLGIKVCQEGEPFSCQGEPAVEEFANGYDEDCDGEIDEDICICGDGDCDSGCAESKETCPYDCKFCGDQICSPSENPAVCPADCCGTCGDGICIGYGCGENPTDCPVDCGTACGNEVCEQGENPTDCAEDCLNKVCGNGICEGTDGGPDECPQDCGDFCGNCSCEGGESFFDCPLDCGYCGDGFCSPCQSLGEDSVSCPSDCCTETAEVCGNGLDDDCDDYTDEEDSLGCVTYYRDTDGDGAGVNSDSKCLCAPSGDYAAIKGGDCDDADPKVLYGSLELCDDADNDCDGAVDEDFQLGTSCSTHPGGVCYQGVIACKTPKATECVNGPTVSSATICEPYSCSNGFVTLASVCNNGLCESPASAQLSCAPYMCDPSGELCRKGCGNDSHCSQGYACDNTICIEK